MGLLKSLFGNGNIEQKKPAGNDWSTLNTEMIRLFNAGQHRQALEAGTKALHLAEEKYQSDHPSVATVLNNLASIFDEIGDYDKAEPLFMKSFKIREKIFGHNHPDVAQSLGNLAYLYDNKGDYEKAEVYFERALTIQLTTLEADHPAVTKTLNNIADFHDRTGRGGSILLKFLQQNK